MWIILFAATGIVWGGAIQCFLPDYPEFWHGIIALIAAVAVAYKLLSPPCRFSGIRAIILLGSGFLLHILTGYGIGLSLGTLLAACRWEKHSLWQLIFGLGFVIGGFFPKWSFCCVETVVPLTWFIGLCRWPMPHLSRYISVLGLVPLTIIPLNYTLLRKPPPAVAALTASLLPGKSAPQLLHVSSGYSKVDKFWQSFPHLRGFDYWKTDIPAEFGKDAYSGKKGRVLTSKELKIQLKNPSYDLIFVENLPSKTPELYLKILARMVRDKGFLIIPASYRRLVPCGETGVALAGSNGMYAVISPSGKIPLYTPEAWDDLWQKKAVEFNVGNTFPSGVLAGLLAPIKYRLPLIEKRFTPKIFWCYGILLLTAVIYLLPKSETISRKWFAFANGIGGILVVLTGIEYFGVHAVISGIPFALTGIFGLMFLPVELRHRPFFWVHLVGLTAIILLICEVNFSELSLITVIFGAFMFCANHNDLIRGKLISCSETDIWTLAGMFIGVTVFVVYQGNENATISLLTLGAYPYLVSLVRGKI